MNQLSKSVTLALAAISIAGASSAIAQDQTPDSSVESEAVLEEVIVTGTRRVIQDQISITRDATVVAVGLSATDIGNLPALSIGEALEAVATVRSTFPCSHRN
jgi:uncharacterized lipoprotein YbaY